MTKFRTVAFWIVAGVAAALVLGWAFPRAYPLFPQNWEVSARDAESLGLEHLRSLAPLPEDPYVVTVQDQAQSLEYRLQSNLKDLDLDELLSSHLVKNLRTWEVIAWAPGARPQEWSHRARVTPAGEVMELLLRVPPDQEEKDIGFDTARRRAETFLQERGIDLENFEVPEIRTRQLQARTDLFLRYRHREALLGDEYPYGLEVTFAGDRLAGYTQYFDDPEIAAIRDSFQPLQLLSQLKLLLPLVLVPLVAIPFVRRYHAGEIGVSRGMQISIVIAIAGSVMLLFCAGAASDGWSMLSLSRKQVTLVVAAQMLVLFFFPMGLMSFLSWSVGESFCRERWGSRLAAFDALFQGDWKNATFAQASLRGISSGLIIVAGTWVVLSALRSIGIWAYSSTLIGPWWESAVFFSIPMVAFQLAYSLYTGLFGRLFLISYGRRWTNQVVAIAFAAIGAVVLFFSSIYLHPFEWNFVVWLGPPLAFIFLFLRYGIFTSALAYFTSSVVTSVVPFFGASNISIEIQVALSLLAVAAPLILSARYLLSERRFEYRYEDVPQHVRRIAERERQRVELETARGIQASILPELPSQLNGIRMTHKYLPATEVGGDFYDVLALEDGRLAVAVGDVAGHGVSSGLVMSMAKSALAVQVTFDPEVEAVFSTLNRMVHQSARRRLLATLCYALIDPVRREMFYASAGHLFPYQISADGQVVALESVSYPLGVRDQIEVRVRSSKLESNDVLFLFSDGVVEARAEGSEEMFGFDRLEETLKRHAGSDVEQVCDGVLADLATFTRGAPREDDLTVLVLGIP